VQTNVIHATRDALLAVDAAGERLRGVQTWRDATKVDPNDLVFANVKQQAADCDQNFGFNVASTLPAMLPPAPSPTMNFAAVDPETADCETAKAAVRALDAEVVYIRSEQIRLGNPKIRSNRMTLGQATGLAIALNDRLSVGKCPGQSVQVAHFTLIGRRFPERLP